MNWSRAKNILLVLFLALNIFLAAYLFFTLRDNSSSANIKYTEEILEKRGYILNTAIPNIKEAYKLEYDIEEFDRPFIAGFLFDNPQLSLHQININQILTEKSRSLVFTSKNSFIYNDEAPTGNLDMSSKARVEKYATNFIKELKLPISAVYLDYYRLNPDKSITLKFIEKYKGVYIFDNSIKFILCEKGIKAIECNLVNIKGFDATKIDITPAYQVLIMYLNSEKKSVIEKIELGYELGSDIGISGNSTPGWRIKFKNGTTIFFDNQDQKK